MKYETEKIQEAIDHLQEYRSIVDNLLYYNYSKYGLIDKLNEIDESIEYLKAVQGTV